MLQPVTPARVLLLLVAVTAAKAQPAPGRTVTVAACPGEPLPEVRVAAGYTTALVLDAPVDKDSVQLDTPQGAPRIRVLAVGERSVHFETLVMPGREERWVLRVRYADGARPEWAAFALVAHPGGAVDMRVDAVRPRQHLPGVRIGSVIHALHLLQNGLDGFRSGIVPLGQPRSRICDSGCRRRALRKAFHNDSANAPRPGKCYQFLPPACGSENGEARPAWKTDRLDIALEKPARTQVRLGEVATLNASFLWLIRTTAKVISTEAPREAAAFQVSGLPSEVRQFPLDLNSTINELCTSYHQRSRRNFDDESAVSQREVVA